MILVRNCPHDNGIYTVIDDSRGVVIKSSYSVLGIDRLRMEHLGYRWYFERMTPLCDGLPPISFLERKGYARLCMPLFPGRAGIYSNNLTRNHGRILQAISTYKKVWPSPQGMLAPLHGDFSIGNLIFDGDSVYIIDWEHFRLNAAPWGFDLVNLVYESAYHSFEGRNTLSLGDGQVFLEIRKAVSASIESSESFNCTLTGLRQFVENNVSIWGELITKLPIMKFSDAQSRFLIELEHY
jgi:hypothetical protein